MIYRTPEFTHTSSFRRLEEGKAQKALEFLQRELPADLSVNCRRLELRIVVSEDEPRGCLIIEREYDPKDAT